MTEKKQAPIVRWVSWTWVGLTNIDSASEVKIAIRSKSSIERDEATKELQSGMKSQLI